MRISALRYARGVDYGKATMSWRHDATLVPHTCVLGLVPLVCAALMACTAERTYVSALDGSAPANSDVPEAGAAAAIDAGPEAVSELTSDPSATADTATSHTPARATLDADVGHAEAGHAEAGHADAGHADAGHGDAGSSEPLLEAGTGDASNDASVTSDAGTGDAAAPVFEALHDEAAFIELEAHSIELDGEQVVVPSARLFTSLLIADEQAESAPLFVLFNGGPGAPTSSLLLMQGTARVRLDPNEPALEPTENPASWTQLGNLLYIDPRQTGFSYSTSSEPLSPEVIEAESRLPAFHYKTDAADLVRVVLRFLAAHPALQDNPVILVGESYGGLRAAAMLAFLLLPESLDQSGYRDLSLQQEVLSHFTATTDSTEEVGPALASRQFGHQILIQPAFSFDELILGGDATCAPGAFAALLADELGEVCPPNSRDAYDLSRPTSYSDDVEAVAALALSTPEISEAFFGVDLREVFGMSAREREGAYRAPERRESALSEAWFDTQGELTSFDGYYTAYRTTGSDSWTQTNFGNVAMLSILPWVHTFITNAQLDAVVNTAVLPDVWARSTRLSHVQADEAPRPGVERSGWIQLNFNQSSPIGEATREIRWPKYEHAGHAVSNNAGPELFEDVAAFLAETLPNGVLVRGTGVLGRVAHQ